MTATPEEQRQELLSLIPQAEKLKASGSKKAGEIIDVIRKVADDDFGATAPADRQSIVDLMNATVQAERVHVEDMLPAHKKANRATLFYLGAVLVGVTAALGASIALTATLPLIAKAAIAAVSAFIGLTAGHLAAHGPFRRAQEEKHAADDKGIAHVADIESQIGRAHQPQEAIAVEVKEIEAAEKKEKSPKIAALITAKIETTTFVAALAATEEAELKR